ncbi:MAG: type II secretion system F family protein [Candidatus Paceibacterota bacterium]
MPTYTFKAKKKDGTVFEETRDAKDKFSLYQDMKASGARVIHANEVSGGTSLWARLLQKGRELSTISTHDIIIFARNLGLMSTAGLSLSRALSVLRRQASNARFKKIIGEIEADIGSGKQLYEALSKHPKVFSRLFISMVKSGEESGTLAESLKTISEQMDRAYTLTKKVRGAMIYPGVIITVMLAIGVLAMVYIVPTLTKTFESMDVDLPFSTRLIIGISEFLRDFWMLNIAALVAFVVAAIWFLRTPAGHRAVDFVLLHTPGVREVVKQINSSRTGRTLSSLLSSGVDYVIAIGITKDVVQNTYYKDALTYAEREVEQGKPISGVFAKYEKLYPIFVSEMASVGEETGQISQMLQNTAEYYEEEVTQKTKNLSTIIEPVLMVIMGIAVGLFAFAMLTPMYSLVDAI